MVFPRLRHMSWKYAKPHVGTYHRLIEMKVENGQPLYREAGDIAKVMVMERHGGDGSYGLGYVQGFGLKAGAVASTVAHDSHNLLIVGTNDEDMALAGNTLAEVGGGMIAVKNGAVIALLPLPIAGLMSDRTLEEVAENVASWIRPGKTWAVNWFRLYDHVFDIAAGIA